MAEGTPIGALAVRIGADANELISELKKADSALGRTSTKFGEGVASAAKFATAAAAAGAAVFALVNKIADSADEIGKMAQKVGMSVEALSGLKYAAELSDVSLEQLGQGLKQLSKFMVENKIQGVSVEEQLLKISDEFSNSADNANKTAVAMKYFGKSGADLIPLLNQGRAGIEEMRREAERLGVVISKEAAQAAEEFNDNMKRLKSTAEGLAIQLAGPLVKALGDTAGKFLEARREGDGFFAAMKRGMQEFLTGDDLYKWQKEMADAGDTLLKAQNALDKLKFSGGAGLGYVRDLQAAEAAVKAAVENIQRLQAIKPVLAPDAPGGKPKPTGTVTVPDKDRDQKDADLIAKQQQEAAEEEIRIKSEVAQLTDDMRAAERAKEKAFQDQRIKDLIDAYEREEQEAIQHGQELIDIDEAVKRNKELLQRQQLSAAGDFLGNLASLTNTHSRKAFELGKVAAIGQAVYKTSLAAIDAWEAGMSVGGPWAPAVAAAYAAAAIAAGANMVNNIRSQTFGGGGGAPTPLGQGSSGIGVVPTQAASTGSTGSRGPDTVIHLHGDTFGRKQLRGLFDQINEENRDGGQIILSGRN